ncbi:TPA: hypothetical protein ACN1LR_005426, partial [Klebsiella pneumoniae]
SRHPVEPENLSGTTELIPFSSGGAAQGSGDNTFDTFYAASGITLGYLKLFYLTSKITDESVSSSPG